MKLLEVTGLRTHFFTRAGVLPVVDGVDFEIGPGESLGLVGESGSGKSVTALSILGLLPAPPGKVVAGEIRFEGRDLARASAAELRALRGSKIAMIFQEPMTALNPVLTVGAQVVEAIQAHRSVPDQEAETLAIALLREVEIPAPELRFHDYPHQLSGGMRQRVMIAMALSSNPQLLIADEPTTALDVTVQAQILELLLRRKRERGTAILLITHDLGVVSEVCERVVVMYAGKVVESGPTARVLAEPLHPYSRGLLDSLPGNSAPGTRLRAIPGNIESPLDFPSGCRFRNRCDRATPECASPPPEVRTEHGQRCFCFHPLGGQR